MDKFYVSRNERWDLGYQRSIVVQFSQGMLKPTTNNNDRYYTNAKVEQHFYPDPSIFSDPDNPTDDEIGELMKRYQEIHKEITENATGLLDASLNDPYEINPLVSIQRTHTCFNDSLMTFFLRNSEFKGSSRYDVRKIFGFF